ncbi:MAG: serine/threonine protein kinase [Planctomycetota bacterium]|nr:MAG: serine/threonine protein kinase [Planctomycetota bacterium]
MDQSFMGPIQRAPTDKANGLGRLVLREAGRSGGVAFGGRPPSRHRRRWGASPRSAALARRPSLCHVRCVQGDPRQVPPAAVRWSYTSGPEASNESVPALAGRRIGPYRVVRRLGQGGMGLVLEVVDPEGRSLALKLQGAGTRSVERFRREGELTARLRHPNVVTVHGGGEHDGRAYLVYELVEGSDLSSLLEERPREELLGYVLQAARGVAHAHARGVIHRDLKPSNVLVGRDGRARVADFGLAAAADLERLTRTGALVGTPRCMAPEQVVGDAEQYGPPTDVWALGVILYRVLTGEEPFAEDSLNAVFAAIAYGPPLDPAKAAPSVSPEVAAVCRRALARAPEKRYPDAGAFADDLERALRGEAPEALRSERRRRVRRVAFSGAGLLLAVGAVLALGATTWLGPRWRARSVLTEHRAWEARVLAPTALGILGEPRCAPGELGARRERLLEAARVLPEEARPHLRLLDAHLRVAGEFPPTPSGMPVLGTEDPLALTADALRSLRAGEHDRARALVARALRADPACWPARLARAALLAEADPGSLVRSARRDEAAARVLATRWRDLVARGVREEAERPVPYLAELPAALGAVPREERAAALREAFEEASAAWGGALESALAAHRALPLVFRLDALLRAWGRPRTGPRLAAALGKVLAAEATRLSKQEALGSRRFPVFAEVEVRLNFACDGLPVPEKYHDMIGLAFFARAEEYRPDERVAAGLGALRVVERLPVYAANQLQVGPAELRPWLERYPERESVCLLAAACRDVGPRFSEMPRVEDPAEMLAAYERALAAPVHDALPEHRAYAWLRVAELRFQLARKEERAPPLAQIVEAASRVRTLAGARLPYVRRALEVECAASRWVEEPEETLERWEAALEAFEGAAKEWRDLGMNSTPALQRCLLHLRFARFCRRWAPRARAWRALEELLEWVLLLPPRSESGQTNPWRANLFRRAAEELALFVEGPEEVERAARLLRPNADLLLFGRSERFDRGLELLVRADLQAGRFPEAKALLRRALARFPESARLRALRRKLRRAARSEGR